MLGEHMLVEFSWDDIGRYIGEHGYLVNATGGFADGDTEPAGPAPPAFKSLPPAAFRAVLRRAIVGHNLDIFRRAKP